MNFHAQIPQGKFAPRHKGPAGAAGLPQCLALIEMRCGPMAHPLGNDARPIDARDICRQIRHRGQGLWLGRGPLERGQQHGHIGARGPCGIGLQRGLQIIWQYLARRPFLRKMRPRRHDAPPRHTRDTRRCLGQRFARLAQKRVHSYA